MKTHELKTWPVFYKSIIDGTKTFEVRQNDRDFQLGDILLLREYDPDAEQYTGAKTERVITYILGDNPFFQLNAMVILGISPLPQQEPEIPTNKGQIRCSNCGELIGNCDMSCYYKDEETPQISVSDEQFEKLLKDVIEWQTKTFGKATPLSKIRHLQKETEELVDDLISSAYDGPENVMLRLEFADNFLLLFGAALSANFTLNDIYDAMFEKLEICKKREWGEPDKDGVVEHIRSQITSRESKDKEIIEKQAELIKIFEHFIIPNDYRERLQRAKLDLENLQSKL